MKGVFYKMSDIITRKYSDRLVAKDSIEALQGAFKKGVQPKVFRTQITATNEFGEVLFSHESNETVLGGALTVLEKLANIKADLKVGSINNIMGINDLVPLEDSSAGNDDILCLWGVGIGGAGDAFGSRRAVKFQEREVGQNGHPEQMLPFRVVPEEFDPTSDNYSRYYMFRTREDGYVEYFLKTFEITPFIKVLFKDGVDGEDGTEVPSDVYNTNRTDPIEAFMEIHLMANRRDIHEYFERIGQVEMARFNTIALFTGRKTEIAEGVFDYTNVKMFSKLTFDNESLQNSKIVNFCYKIYVA